jgi:hypothetical protein
MDLAQLRVAEPGRVFRAAESIGRIADGLRDAANGVNATIRRPLADGVWSGTASTAALAHIDRVGEDLAGTVETLGQTGQQVRRFAEALADAKALLARADDIAGAARLTIGADGSVTFPTFATPLTETEAQDLKAAGEEAHRLLGKALTMAADADAACAGALATAAGAGEAAGAAAGSMLAATGSSDGGGDGLWDRVTGAFDDPERDFDDSMLGSVIEQVSEGDSIWEQLGFDPDQGGLDIGNMTPLEEEAFDETFGASPDELLGEEVVDTISEDGVWAGVEQWWDQSWEGAANVPDRISEGWDDLTEGLGDFADDPVGTIGGLFD